MIETMDNNVAKILTLIRKGENTKEIARKLNFDSHRSMALFMRENGYIWDDNKSTYVLESKIKAEDENNNIKAPHKENEQKVKSVIDKKVDNGSPEIQNYAQKYSVLLEYLDQRKDLLGELFEEAERGVRLPRYTVPGIHITKSVHMVYELDQLVREFSKEKNVSQREIFEIALINFFKRYGYKDRVDVLLQD